MYLNLNDNLNVCGISSHLTFADPPGYTIAAPTAKRREATSWRSGSGSPVQTIPAPRSRAGSRSSSLRPGDWIAYYSPTTTLGGGDKVQAFTSIGRVASEPYEAEATLGDAGRHPWRVDVDYEADAKAASIRPLLERLDLTRGKGSRWGMAVRGSKVKGTDADLRLIAMAMAVQIAP